MSNGKTKTDIPFRLDRLPWSRWHVLVVVALGITWILDGLEVTIVGVISDVLQKPTTLALSSFEAGFLGTAYLIGAVVGAIVFSYLTDKYGRKRLFMITLGTYIVGTVLSAFSFNFASIAVFRIITGLGIGGEYSAINSAIDELIPARVRGWVDLAINGSWWVGTMVGSALSLYLLNPAFFPIDLGWRLSFAVGASLGLAVLLIRRYLPESPRWLLVHGREEEAKEVVSEIENKVSHQTGKELEEPNKTLEINPIGSVGFGTVFHSVFGRYPKRAVLGLWLMAGQAFLYNAIFFTYALLLSKFYGVPVDQTGLYIFPFAIGNFVGPLLIGKLFDTFGRKPMIAFTYIFSGVLLAITGYLFMIGVLSAITQTLAWVVIFFFASAGASSAYLTVSEVFPLEIRAMAIALFYAVGTAIGGVAAPSIFGALIGSGSPVNVFYGYLVGAILMAAAGVVEIAFGVKAERKSLEEVAAPLSEVIENPY
ncbi:MFS transporter [Sulfuracidifex tepidarius]|uniref:Sialic acid transporter n=1 Tax=Sulfuracidifex tepidarius TaxID=1294262 RepID=A0A510E036_9CREN|nr:MFS transporter [Sulfuracidifex tepidarius]BBG23101.1 Putative sialic acid transporter [Sulfuracidifex tepidarius]BBG25849.1 Putative sialic acid transporter [Sulfuracidifex tepidarius]